MACQPERKAPAGTGRLPIPIEFRLTDRCSGGSRAGSDGKPDARGAADQTGCDASVSRAVPAQDAASTTASTTQIEAHGM